MWWICGIALAQEPDQQEKTADLQEDTEERIIAQLPQILETTPVSYPEAALIEGFGGSVLLNLMISETGEVLQAEVAESLRPDMDDAALEALFLYRFSPALDQLNKPISCLIQYRFVFEPSTILPLSLEGNVLEAGVKKPLSGTEVIAVNKDGTTLKQRTDENGHFKFRGLTPGDWAIMASAPALEAETATVHIQVAKVSEVQFYLIRDQAVSAQFDLEIIVEARAETAEITERFLSGDDISYLPGSGGDIVRAIQNLPGIARPPFGLGQLIIRGTAPENSRYYLDGVQIPDVFHFGGLTTVISSNSIEEVAYIPGNYSVRYGRQLSGLVDLRTKTNLPEDNIAKASVDIFQSELYLQQRINDELAISVSGRRSYADFVLNPILKNMDISVRAPRYYDAQVGLLYKPSATDLIDITYLMSDDQFQFLGSDSEENQANLSYQKSFQKARVRWKHDMINDWKQETTLIAGPEDTNISIGDDTEVNFELRSAQLRHEYSLIPNPENLWGFRTGIDILGGRDSTLIQIPDIETEESLFPFISPALYGEVTRDINDFRAIMGLRSDAHIQKGDVFILGIDPRLALRYNLTDNTSFNLGAGVFSQIPATEELDEETGGTADLTIERSYQYALGFTHQFLEELKWEATGFYNELDQLVVGSGTGTQFGGGPPRSGTEEDPFRNGGTGRVYGFESLIRYDGINVLALLSTTFSRSERTDENGNTSLFSYDQPYLINGLFSWMIPKNRRLGARARYGSGNPYTPVVNSIYNLDSRSFTAINGEADSERLASFFSLDVRYDKTYTFDKWKLTSYLDIQNITNYQNVEIMSYSFDYSEEQPITGLPIFPAIGLKGEW